MPYAIVIREGTFSAYKLKRVTGSAYPLNREGAVKLVVDALGESTVVSTTGKTSRELFEHREATTRTHVRDFRTVGCMGHASQIAMGIAIEAPARTVVCLDGDGAVIMHMGSLAIQGTQAPPNYKHIVINNGAHDSVGGQPTVGFSIDICAVAAACGYRWTRSVSAPPDIEAALRDLVAVPGPALLEIRVNKGARADLGRPTVTPAGNKQELMAYLRS
jgi:phosphonopyruvate decarboxylase